MKVNNIQNSPQFKGVYNNKILLKGLEFASNHSASFIAGATLLSSTVLRPLAINSIDNADEDNKKIFTAESISSGLTKFALAEMIAIPVENGIKMIDKNKEKYLNRETLQNLSPESYKFLTKSIKLGSNFISAIPKSMIGVALIPVVHKLLFDNEKQSNKVNNNNISFKGKLADNSAKIISKVMNNEVVQNFANKFQTSDKNLAKNVSVATDILLCSTSILSTQKSKKIDKERKKPLIFNKALSTIISLVAGYKIDELIQKTGKKSIEKFIQANKNNPNLQKYLDGINIVRPTIIFAFLYYALIPVITTFASDKLNEQTKNVSSGGVL